MERDLYVTQIQESMILQPVRSDRCNQP